MRNEEAFSCNRRIRKIHGFAFIDYAMRQGSPAA
jgi:hypothetical protein